VRSGGLITGTFLGSAVLAVVLAWVMVRSIGGVWGFQALLMATFFLASAGASAAYLTVSEIFPMETRALAIAFFYALGTAVGGISGPLLFGQFIESGSVPKMAVAFIFGAVVMAIGGIVEIFFGVRAEQARLEDIALPLTAQEAPGAAPGAADPKGGAGSPAGGSGRGRANCRGPPASRGARGERRRARPT
jgi:MFS family permease